MEGDKLTELVDEPELVEGTGEANRWQNYGKDRIYINDNDFSGKYDAYIDLQTGEFVCDYSSDFQMEIDDGTATITKHWVGGGEEHSEVVAVVQLFETEEEANTDDEESECDDGENATVEVPIGRVWECDTCDFEIKGDSIACRERAREHADEHPDHDVERCERHKEYPAEAVCDRCELKRKQAGEDYCTLCVLDLGGPARLSSSVDPEEV